MTDIIFTPAADDDPSFTPTTTTNHNTLPGRSTADAHPASAITTDNDWNGNLTAAGTNLAAVLDVIDDLALGGGGGAVDSVNGETGTVVLDAADVDAVPITAVGLLAGETNRGDWSGATAYVVGDVVHDHGGDGGVYVCTVANTNEQPSLTPAKWTAIDGTGREFAVGAGSHAGDSALSIGPGATSDGGGLSIGPGATSDGGGLSVGPYAAADGYGLSVGLYAVSGAAGLSIGTQATSGVAGLAIGTGATSGDYEVNVSGIYKGTVDSGDPTVPTGASIATGFVDLPETADVTNPAAGSQRLVARTDGLYVRDEAGTEVGPLGAGGSGIPATIIDAAGDLIVGTAADTAARLAVGTSGQVLTSNGTTAAWAMPWTATHAPTITATAIGSNESCVYSTPGQRTANTNHGLTAAGAEVWVPLPFDAGTYDRISVYVTTAAVSTWRIGLDSMATNGKFAPGANVLDAGTLNMNTGTGHQALNISLTIPTTGIYWARVLCTAYTGSPGTVNLDGNSGNSWASMVCRGWPSSPASYLRGFVGHVGSTGGTGAFAATPAPAALGTVLPVVYFRRAS